MEFFDALHVVDVDPTNVMMFEIALRNEFPPFGVDTVTQRVGRASSCHHQSDRKIGRLFQINWEVADDPITIIEGVDFGSLEWAVGKDLKQFHELTKPILRLETSDTEPRDKTEQTEIRP